MRGRLLALALCSAAALFACGRAPSSNASRDTGAVRSLAGSASVVISQVYGGGGNTNATYTHDFIELFNRGATPASLTGWSLQYASSAGTGNFGAADIFVTPLSGTIAPGQYILVQEASSAAVGAALPTADITDSTPINMSGSAGKVALVNSTTSLGCNGGSAPCTAPQLAMVVDLVGYGGSNFYEGNGAAPTLSSTTAALRGLGGCTDTDNNATDFTAGTPSPRNSTSPTNTCGAPVTDPAPTVQSTSPTNGATGVLPSTNISITFSESVNITGSWAALSCGASGAVGTAVSGGPKTFTLNPASDLAAGKTCTVTVTAGLVTDQDSIDPPDAMTSNYVFSFTVAPTARIHEVQGAAHTSPLNGRVVVDVEGIVTAVRSNGFYFQDPNPDADDATSEALFVFTNTVPTVSPGDAVKVTGKVTEFRPGGSSGSNLTTTELSSPLTISVVSSGNALPAATVIGQGGRTPPTAVIEDDATGNVETSGSFDPASDGLDFYESLEGMRVQVNDPVAAGPSNGYGEIPVLADGGVSAAVRTTRGGVVIRPDDFNPERIILDDEIVKPAPEANVGDTLNGPAIGVLDYSFGNFKLELTSAITANNLGLSRETSSATGANELSVATFNVENLDPGDPASKFSDLASLIVSNLRAPDLLAIEEIQDNNGATNDAVVNADVTLNMFVSAIQAAGGPIYQYRLINPVDDMDGGEPGGNIRVAFLFRTDRGLAFVDRPGGTPTSGTAVLGTGGTTQLTYSPGRIDPTNPAFNTSRKPLAGEFTYQGQKLFAIANHFASKGGDDPLFGRNQPPVLSSEIQRLNQARVVAGFVTQLLTASPAANVVVLGDLNDFQFSGSLVTLKNAGLKALIETLPIAERYTYVYDGNSQALDHTLASAGAFAKLVNYDIVHVNSEFTTRASDHDPQVTYLSFRPPATLVVPGLVNLKAKNNPVTPVTVLSSTALDATQINPASATLGDGISPDASLAQRNNGTLQSEVRDVNGDGLLDLTLMFTTAALVENGDLKAGTNTVYLYALLNDDLTQITGSATIRAK